MWKLIKLMIKVKMKSKFLNQIFNNMIKALIIIKHKIQKKKKLILIYLNQWKIQLLEKTSQKIFKKNI